MSITRADQPTPKITIVAVHGFISSTSTWDTMAAMIGADQELAGVLFLRYPYHTKIAVFRPDRRIPNLNDLADGLQTFIAQQVPPEHDVVLLTHSQGGLVVQRYLAQRITDNDGAALARVRSVIMYACPNAGSEFLHSLRRPLFGLLLGRNAQERALRPFDEQVLDTHRILARRLTSTSTAGPDQFRIPILSISGSEDNIVPPKIAKWVWADTESVPGDHFSVIKPPDRLDSRYLVLKRPVLRSLEADTGPPAEPAADQDPSQQIWVPALFTIDPPVERVDTPLRGRDELINTLVAASTQFRGRRVHVLYGLPGCGKSQVSLEVAKRVRTAGRTVWWVSAERIDVGMREVANQLGAPAHQLDRTWSGAGSATDLVWRFLNDATQPWLLIIDNADDPALLAEGGLVADGNGWLRRPAGENGMVLVTSREGDPARWGAWVDLHQVRPLDAPTGAVVLMDRTGNAAGDEKSAEDLAAELGGLPLALRAAGDYLKSVNSTKVYRGDQRITDFESYRHALQQKFHPDGDDSGAMTESLGLELVENVYDMSLKLLADGGVAHAREMVRTLACFGFAPLPYGLLLQPEVLATSPLFPKLTDGRYQPVLEGLSNLSMIDLRRLPEIDQPELSHVLELHPLVRGIVRNRVRRSGQPEDYYAVVMRQLHAAIGPHDPDNFNEWEVWHSLAPHALEVTGEFLLSLPASHDLQITRLALGVARKTARYLIATGLGGQAQGMLRRLIAECHRYDFRPDNAEILALRHEYARTILDQRPADAEALLHDIIADRERVLGAQDADTLASRHKRANAIMRQEDRWDEAERELRSIVAAEKTVRGPEHSDTMIVRHSLARAIARQGRQEEALRMCREILAVRLRLWPENEPETIFVRHSIAVALAEMAETRQSERDGLLTEADLEVEKTMSLLHGNELLWPQTIWLRYTHARIRLLQQRIPEAIAELEVVARDRMTVLGLAHPETQRTLSLLERWKTAAEQRPVPHQRQVE